MVALSDVVWTEPDLENQVHLRAQVPRQAYAFFRDSAGTRFEAIKWTDGDLWFRKMERIAAAQRNLTEFELACLIAPLTQEVSDG
jgi:hypothetical protein